LKFSRFALASLVLCLALVGCNGAGGQATQEGGGTAGATGAGKALRVGMVFDSGGRGDKSFNDSAFRGLERAQKELGVTILPTDSKAESDYQPNLETLAQQGCDLVIAVGINMRSALENVAPNYPNVRFAIVDANVEGENVRSLLFKEEEGSFLAGYLAGLITETNTIGFVGGQQIDLIKKFESGYIAGARMANPNINVLPAKYTGSWDNVDLGKESARVLFNQGADIVYHAAGRAGLGVFAAAKDANRYAIGVDSDQDHLEPGTILTSMIKRVDEAVFQTIKDLQEGNFTAGAKVYDVAAGGVGLSDMQHTRDRIGEQRLARIEEVRQLIIEREITVPTTEAELRTFTQSLRR
jgi:basic membrane protein A and related proteins